MRACPEMVLLVLVSLSRRILHVFIKSGYVANKVNQTFCQHKFDGEGEIVPECQVRLVSTKWSIYCSIREVGSKMECGVGRIDEYLMCKMTCLCRPVILYNLR